MSHDCKSIRSSSDSTRAVAAGKTPSGVVLKELERHPTRGGQQESDEVRRVPIGHEHRRPGSVASTSWMSAAGVHD